MSVQFTEYRLTKLEKDLEGQEKRLKELELEMVAIKVKMSLYAAIGGVLGSALATAAFNLLH